MAKVYSNGFLVDTETGLCSKGKAHYFINERKKKQEEIIIIEKRQYIINQRIKKNEFWALKKSDNRYNIIIRLDSILNYLSKMISIEIRKRFKKYIIRKKPNSIKQLYFFMFKYILTMKLPITTSEFLEAVKRSTNKRDYLDFYKDMRNIRIIRKYYWYINKRLNSLKYLSNEKKIELYNSVKQYYKLTRFKLCIACNPLKLIDYLIYETLNQHYTHIPKSYRALRLFDLSSDFKNHNLESFKKLNNININTKHRLLFKRKPRKI